MPSNKSLLQTTSEFSPEQQAFLAKNQEMLEQLATFVDFAPERLTVGFVSVNFTKDRDTMLEALRQHPRCQDIQFVVLGFPNPELRFLRDAILERLPTIELQPNKKLVLVITGLEYSIGMIGDSPPALQDLNYVRDSFTTSVPHPMLICLPDWSLTRLARYAPDFWAWRLAVFRFEHLPTTAANVKQETLDSDRTVGSLDLPEQQTQIDLLLRLLMEYDQAKPSESYDHTTHTDILDKLGELYNLQGKTKQAEEVLTQALHLIPVQVDSSIIASIVSVLNNLADVMASRGNVGHALLLLQQALKLSDRIENVEAKAATLNNMARVIGDQGDIEQALQLWNQSLELKERVGDMHGIAATLNNMAVGIANQGDTEQALQLWNQSLKLNERIKDMRGTAATLGNMAGVIAAQGDIEQAMQLWNQSLELYERIGDVGGKASALANMAYIAGETGDKARQLTLNLQAAQALGQVRAYVNLVTVLGNLGASAEINAVVYLAQAIWLCLRIQAPLVDTLKRIEGLFDAVPQGDVLKILLAATALWFCKSRGAGHPQLAQLRKDSWKMISVAANTQSIQTQEEFDAWFTQQQLDDPEFFLPQLNQRLEEMIGDGWLFDPNAVTK